MGVSNFLVFICGLLLLPFLSGSGILILVVLVTVVLSCFAFDLAVRRKSNVSGRWMRLLSPSAGGSLFFVPIWAVYPIMALTGLVMLLFTK
jgi:hypothetical protein